jgi:molybdenum cofactor cytidylyltransferase
MKAGSTFITAIVLAAGFSRRMGRPKLVLPWGKTTVIEQVVGRLLEAGVEDVLVVTGGARSEVEDALSGIPVRIAFNPRLEQSEMIDSLQLGLQNIDPNAEAVLIVLGDQPQLKVETIRKILEAHQSGSANLVIPSFQNRRGHPWLVGRALWPEILEIHPPGTLRDFLSKFGDLAVYIDAEEDSILRDLDTPGDYAREKPAAEEN